MIFWSRMGFLVFIFLLAASGLVMFTLNTLFGEDFYGTHPWAFGFGPILGGLISSAVGFAIRPRGGRKVIDAKTRKAFILKEPDHTFMFIPMHWCGLVLAGLGVCMFIGGFFVPPSKAVVERQARERAQAQAGVAHAFPPRGFPQNQAAVPDIFPPRGVAPNPAPVFNPEALNLQGNNPQAVEPPAAAAQPPAVVPPVARADEPPPAAAHPPAAVIRPPAAGAFDRDTPNPVSEDALAAAPPDSRAVREGEKLEVGTRVLANWAFDEWEVAVIDDLPADGEAHVDYLRLEGFSEVVGYDRIRMLLPKEEIDPDAMVTLTFAMTPNIQITKQDLPRIEEELLKLQGYIPETVEVNSKSRRVSLVVIRDSFASKFCRSAFAELKMFLGREFKK